MHSNKTRRLSLFLTALTVGGSVLAQTENSITSHCNPDEKIQFSCRIGAKFVSLCSGGSQGKITLLTYRYGARGKVESEFISRPENKNRFYGTEMQASPRARVKQVWFNRGKLRYLLTECVGGSCEQGGGLAVLRGYRVVMNGRCDVATADDYGSFASELVSFESKLDYPFGRSKTDLLIIVNGDDHFEKLFPSRP